MTQLLFVCTGNTCRSPMAELYFNHYCSLRGHRGVRAFSAGVMADPGSPISEPARRVLASFGIETEGFRSRPLTAGRVGDSDLIVVMAESHLRRVLARFPEAAEKTRMLLESPDGGFESVPDPYGGPPALYAAAFLRMRPALEALADRIGQGGV